MEKEAERAQGVNSAFPRLLFLGTPEFAVPSIQRLISDGAPVLAAVTQPDRPRGRGARIAAPPVKRIAESAGIPVYQPERIKEPGVIAQLQSMNAECAVVVAYGQLLPQDVLDLFPLGAINVHGSVLPLHRGAAPIQRSILAGDSRTGVSIMILDSGMDTGPVLSRSEIPIGEMDCYGTVYDRLALLGAELLCETLKAWKAGAVCPEAQDNALATYAPPIRKEEIRIDWRLPAHRIVNTIRAFDPHPGAFAHYRGKRLKCFGARLLPWKRVPGKPGDTIGEAETGLAVLGGDGKALSIGALQLEGQKRLTAAEFLRGHPMTPGTSLD